MELVSVLRGIHESDIDVTLRSRGDVGWQLQIDIEGGNVARGVVRSLDDAATWLHEQVLVHFPDSEYAQSARGGVRKALPDDSSVRELSG